MCLTIFDLDKMKNDYTPNSQGVKNQHGLLFLQKILWWSASTTGSWLINIFHWASVINTLNIIIMSKTGKKINYVQPAVSLSCLLGWWPSYKITSKFWASHGYNYWPWFWDKIPPPDTQITMSDELHKPDQEFTTFES